MERILPIPAYIASLAPRNVADARRLLALVPPEANALEYRLDLSEEAMEPAAVLELDLRPAILTYRSLREGGGFQGSIEEYRRFVTEAYRSGGTVDVEHASGLLGDPDELPDRRRTIASLHSPFSLPEDWAARLSAMVATGARAAKLVAGAADLKASLAIAEIQKRQGDACVAAFPMGPASPPGRVLSALFGAALVYGSIERETAAGQIAIRDLLGVYEVQENRQPESLFGIIGENPSRSLSPLLHNALFRARGLPFLYLPLPVSDFEREAPHRVSFDPPFRGFSVTQPWKLQAAQAGVPSEDVAMTRAANTLVFERGRWRAENTDVDGIFDTLADHDTGEGRSAIVLGAGGAARAAVVAAKRLGYEVAVAARRDEEADRLAAALRVDSMAWGDVEQSEADLYVNATSAGWSDGESSPIPSRVLEGRPLVFDFVYRRDGAETATIQAARAAGCPTIDGLRMFAAQAVRQAQLFGADGVSVGEVMGILGAGVQR
ncbi:MAG TPA: type I 3-dehydroquinate dehydratase [Thermoanaerobaculia bacterium]|jgi:shikimate dehydrogenase/3-dehydroquinate dehydratase type I